jgi:hypothetical protein
MRRLILMVLISLIAGLAGCGESGFKQPPQADASPPPKPPNCPDLPELANLKLADGGIADVRIFRDGEETFYVPFSWFEFEARIRKEEYWKDLKKRKFNYGIHEIECSGVVHVGAFSLVTPHSFGSRNLDRGIPPNFSSQGKISSVHFFRIPGALPDSLGIGKLDSTGEGMSTGTYRNPVYMIVSENIVATADDFPYDEEYRKAPSAGGTVRDAYIARAMASDEWRDWRQSIHELYAWLKTRPKDRDNEKIFTLGVKNQ